MDEAIGKMLGHCRIDEVLPGAGWMHTTYCGQKPRF